jgi:large subunit ribosomal protein L2
VIVDRSELYKGKPVKALTVGKSSTGGRNNLGRDVDRLALFEGDDRLLHVRTLTALTAEHLGLALGAGHAEPSPARDRGPFGALQGQAGQGADGGQVVHRRPSSPS